MKRVLRTAAILLAGLCWAGCSTTGFSSKPDSETSFTPVSSETLYSVRYEAETQVLTVVRRNGDVADYLAVPKDVADGLLQAAEPDAFFRDRIASVFESRKVEF